MAWLVVQKPLLPLFLLLALSGLAGAREVEVRVGLTLSLSGWFQGEDAASYTTIPGVRCHWCAEVQVTINKWAEKLNERVIERALRTKANDTLLVRFDVRDDFSYPPAAVQHYAQMMDSGTDFFLGPAFFGWQDQIADMIRARGKLVLNWVSHKDLYISSPFSLNTNAAYGWVIDAIFSPLPNDAPPAPPAGEPEPEGESGNETGGVPIPTLAPPEGEEEEGGEDNGTQGEDGNETGRRLGQRKLGSREFGKLFAGESPLQKTREKACPAAAAWLAGHAGKLPPVGLDSEGVVEWFRDQRAPKELVQRVAKNLRASNMSLQAEERHLSGTRTLQENGSLPASPLALQGATGNQSLAFNINLPESWWAWDALEKVRDNGANSFLFVYFSDGPGAAYFEQNCRSYEVRMRNEGKRALSYALTYQDNGFLLDMRLLRWVNPDVLFYCGQLELLRVLSWGTMSFAINPKAFIVDRPIGHLVPTQALSRTYFIEPWPMPFLGGSTRDLVLGTLDEFVAEFRGVIPRGLGFAGVQVASALSVLLHALQNADDVSPSAVAEYLRRQPFEVDTFMGRQWEFNAEGSPQVHAPSTRQIEMMSMYDACVPGQSGVQTEQDRHERYINTKIVQVAPAQQVQSCPDWQPGGLFPNPLQDCAKYLTTSLVYPALPYATRQVIGYPCMPGCLKKNGQDPSAIEPYTCIPCPSGRYHSWNNSECRDCPAGTYAHKEGMTACIECPQPGSICDRVRAEVPRAKKDYFLLVDDTDNTRFNCSEDSRCGNDAEVAVFAICRPRHVCQDGRCLENNLGRSCGQCAAGYTYQGLRMGRRQCKQCPEVQVVVGYIGIYIAFYGGMTVAFAQLGYWAAMTPGYVPLHLARAVLHYIHLLGTAFEVTQLDAEGSLGYLMTPIDMFYRPIDLLMFNCLYQDTDSKKSIHEMSTFYTALMPAGYVAIILGGVLFWFSNFIKNAFMAVVVSIRRYRQHGRLLESKIAKKTKSRLSESSSASPGSDVERSAARASVASVGLLGELPARTSVARPSVASLPRPSVRSLTPVSADGLKGEDEDDDDRSVSDESIAAEEHVKFSLLHGPGLNFNEHLEALAIQASLAGGLIRTCFAWTLLMYPVTLRGFARLLACDRFDLTKTSSYMVVNYDIRCYSDEYYDMVSKASLPYIPMEALAPVVCMLVPAVLFLYLRLTGTEPLLYLRRRSAILFDGYRYGSWEAMQFLRTGLMIVVANWVQTSVRVLFLMLMVVVFFALESFLRPFEPRYREALHNFEMSALFGILCVLAVGQIAQATEAFQQRHSQALGLLVFFLNFAIILSTLFFLFVARVSIKIQAIIESGSSVSTKAMRVHRFIQWYPGVSPVYFFSEGDSNFIDVSHLNSSEKTNLARTINATVSICIDQRAKFKTWVVERALTEAFRRAIGGRKAMLRTLYETFGTNNFKVGRIFQASLQPPDRPEVGRENIGVTVDELNDALMDVNRDLRGFHPSIFGQPPTSNSIHEHELHYDEQKRVCKEWSSLYTVEDIIRDIVADEKEEYEMRGSLNKFRKSSAVGRLRSSLWSTSEVETIVSEAKNTVLDELEDEQDDLQGKRHMSRVESVRKLTEELQTLDKECQDLMHQLRQATTGPERTITSSSDHASLSSQGGRSPSDHLLEVRKER